MRKAKVIRLVGLACFIAASLIVLAIPKGSVTWLEVGLFIAWSGGAGCPGYVTGFVNGRGL